ncbi:MAG: hypothetical protein L3V56_11650 [Candidatus Magnetoovum sp. WYHC-5]|nr:hypothetical protein [Candidatus Magnetoovum sp. WYHC-5]
MKTQNLTLSIPEDLIEKIADIAVVKNKSLNELICEIIEKIVIDNTEYQVARNRQIALMKKGLILNAKEKITLTKEELYDRG